MNKDKYSNANTSERINLREKEIVHQSLIFYTVLVMLLFIFAIKIGSRDITIGTDFFRYYSHYLLIVEEKTFIGRFEPGYQLLELIGASLKLEPETFFIFVALIQLTMIIWAYYKWTSLVFHRSTLDKVGLLWISMSIALFTPFVWNGLINVIRHGLASSTILIALAYLIEKQYLRAVLLFGISVSFHITSFVFVIPAILFIKFKRLTIPLLSLGILLYGGQLSDKLMINIESITNIPIYSMITQYNSQALHYKIGYRYDFLLFSITPVIITKLVQSIFRKTLHDIHVFNYLVTAYGALLVPFLLFGYAAYMDRWLLPAWTFLPVYISILIYFFVMKIRGLNILLNILALLGILLSMLLLPYTAL